MFKLQFKTGDEWFVGAEDLHDTTWTANADEATVYQSRVEAQQMADAMARTQGVLLKVVG